MGLNTRILPWEAAYNPLSILIGRLAVHRVEALSDLKKEFKPIADLCGVSIASLDPEGYIEDAGIMSKRQTNPRRSAKAKAKAKAKPRRAVKRKSTKRKTTKRRR